MDADEAGEKAASELACLSRAVKIIQVPIGKDMNKFYRLVGEQTVRDWLKEKYTTDEFLHGTGARWTGKRLLSEHRLTGQNFTADEFLHSMGLSPILKRAIDVQCNRFVGNLAMIGIRFASSLNLDKSQHHRCQWNQGRYVLGQNLADPLRNCLSQALMLSGFEVDAVAVARSDDLSRV